MALCPECLESKFALSPRCPNCNQEIGFIRQMAHVYAQWGTFLCGLWFLVSLFTGGWLVVLAIWIFIVVAPAFFLAVIMHPDNN